MKTRLDQHPVPYIIAITLSLLSLAAWFTLDTWRAYSDARFVLYALTTLIVVACIARWRLPRPLVRLAVPWVIAASLLASIAPWSLASIHPEHMHRARAASNDILYGDARAVRLTLHNRCPDDQTDACNDAFIIDSQILLDHTDSPQESNRIRERMLSWLSAHPEVDPEPWRPLWRASITSNNDAAELIASAHRNLDLQEVPAFREELEAEHQAHLTAQLQSCPEGDSSCRLRVLGAITCPHMDTWRSAHYSAIITHALADRDPVSPSTPLPESVAASRQLDRDIGQLLDASPPGVDTGPLFNTRSANRDALVKRLRGEHLLNEDIHAARVSLSTQSLHGALSDASPPHPDRRWGELRGLNTAEAPGIRVLLHVDAQDTLVGAVIYHPDPCATPGCAVAPHRVMPRGVWAPITAALLGVTPEALPPSAPPPTSDPWDQVAAPTTLAAFSGSGLQTHATTGPMPQALVMGLQEGEVVSVTLGEVSDDQRAQIFARYGEIAKADPDFHTRDLNQGLSLDQPLRETPYYRRVIAPPIVVPVGASHSGSVRGGSAGGYRGRSGSTYRPSSNSGSYGRGK